MNEIADQVQQQIDANRDPVSALFSEATNWLGSRVDTVRADMVDLAEQINDAQARLADARHNVSQSDYYLAELARLAGGLTRYRDGQSKRVAAMERRLREMLGERHVIEDYDSGV